MHIYLNHKLHPRSSDYDFHKKILSLDIIAGTTVAVVALPLALGFSITVGLPASAGLITAILAGLVAAIFGGSKYQVSGPTGAMTVILIPVVHTYGPRAIPLLGLMAGILVIIMALARLGAIINRVPWSVVEGFTAGIAGVIALQQLPLALGVPKARGDRTLSVAWRTIRNAVDVGIHWQTLGIVVFTLLVKFAYPRVAHKMRIRAHIPASFVAILASLLLVRLFSIPVKTIGMIPRSLGNWRGSDLALSDIPHLLWPALMIAILCAIESLLSARVADGMLHPPMGEKYHPNRELLGQGLATAVASMFGGMPATGALARTSVNVRAHARTRMAAIFHSVVLIFAALIAAPMVSQIPSAAIAGVLLGTSYRILNPTSLRESFRTTRREAAVLLVTAIACLAIDLIWGIALGILLYWLLHRGKRS